MKNVIKNVILIILIIIISSSNQVFADYTNFQELYMPKIGKDGKEEKNNALVERIADNIMNGKISEETAITAIKNGETGTAFIKDNINTKFNKDADYKKTKSFYAEANHHGYYIDEKLKTNKQLKKALSSYEDYLLINKFPRKHARETSEQKKAREKLAKKYATLLIAYKKLQLIDAEIQDIDFSKEENVEKKLNEVKKEEKEEEKKDAKNELPSEENTKKDTDSPIYVQPKATTTGNNSSESSLEDMIKDADTFVNTGTAQYNQTSMQNFSKIMYNILLTVGVFVAVIVGGIIGIKLMVSSAAEKADAKKLLVPYVVGCVVVFGGFGIWKLVVTILQGM